LSVLLYCGTGRAGAQTVPSDTQATLPIQAPAGAVPATAAAGETEDITVIAPTPLLGSGVDRDKIPANTVVLRSADLDRTGTASATRALNENSGSVDLDEAVGNEFQPNLLFRGFEASPLAGDAQGLAVYVNGSRFNSSFADATNWDVIPDVAIRELDVVGSNPAFGLNALGGAVAVRLKDGFSNPGTELEASGGSFGRIQLSGQYGVQVGDFAAYIAATGANDDAGARIRRRRCDRLTAISAGSVTATRSMRA